jgi:hypothetical protein
MELISTILQSPEFAAFLVSVLVAVATFVGKSLRDLLVRNLTAKQLEMLMTIAVNAIRVAEQLGYDQTGEEKKAEAIRIAQTYLDAYGIKVSAAQLSAAIEAAVFAELTKSRLPAVTEGEEEPAA